VRLALCYRPVHKARGANGNWCNRPGFADFGTDTEGDRQSGGGSNVQFVFAEHTLDIDRRELRRGAEPIAVEPQVLDLLIYVVQNRNRVVTKDDLIASIWGGRIVSDATLTSRIYAARKAVGDDGHGQKLIRTIARKGLRFVADVHTQVNGHDAAPPSEAPPRPTVIAAHRDLPTRRPSAGSDGCSARVFTEPSDAKVSWRGQMLGKSPIANAKIPCGAGALTIVHERYQTLTREVTAEADTPVAISERLHRPPAMLIVGSSPPGAMISVNGQALGAAPRRLPTSRYEQVSIRATLVGHPPWTKKVYLSEATTKVTAQLGSGRGR